MVPVAAARRHRLASLFDVIDASAPEGTGALHIGDGPNGGAVLLDDGRVCWAAAPGAGRRLVDLICQHAAVSRREVAIAYAECLRRGAPFGELLVERKLVAPGALRALLLRHTSETLVGLAEQDGEAVWIPHRGAGYRPRYRFTLPELAASTTAAGLAIEVDVACDELAAVVTGEAAGAAFDVDSDDGPLAFAVRGDASYDEIRALGDWVTSVASRWPSEAFPGFIVASVGTGGLVAWATGGCLFGARFDTASGLVGALAHLKRRT